MLKAIHIILVFVIIVLIVLASASADTRITNASPAASGQFPWMVAVRHSGTFLCGGALIHHRWVLTSGECVWHYKGSERYTVLVGGLSILGGFEPGRVELIVREAIPHPKFRQVQVRDTLYYYNLGLLNLAESAPLSITIRTIGFLPQDTLYPDGFPAQLSGWGGSNARVSPVLQYAMMSTVNANECAKSVGGGTVLNSGQLCTEPAPSSSACWYDHGSPLIGYSDVGVPFIIGVTAYAGCLDPVHPTIYTNPSFVDHSRWITQLTGIPI